MFVRSLDLDPNNDFEPAIRELESKKLIKKVVIYDSSIQATSVRAIRNVCHKQLKNDPFIYLSNRNAVQKKIRDNAEKKKNETLAISIFGNKNSELFEQHLFASLEEFLPERKFVFKKLPFGQMYKYLFDQTDVMHLSPPFIKVFIDRLEDVPGVNLFDTKATLTAIKEYINLIKGFHDTTGGWSIVNLFAQINTQIGSHEVCQQNELVFKCNQMLIDAFNNLNQVAFLDLSAEMASYCGLIVDPRLDFLGKFPFSNGFSSHLAQSWASLIIAMLGKDARLMVIDLDNTLWGGVLGEDGVEGLKIGGDYPGNAFKAFQYKILEHQKRGVALAIASKNDKDLALNAISNLPDMVIREENIQAHGINWEPKWKNIIRICDDLNLGLGSVLFIDDNPVEREAVKRNLPDVKILPLTSDPAEYVSILKNSPYLRPITITTEDLGRLNDFSVRNERKLLKATAADLNDYFSSLKISLNLNNINAGNSTRAAQLCQKTNQFNTTTRRYDQKKLDELKASGCDVMVINYQDKFSPPENIGLIIIKYDKNKTAMIDLFLLSCRVLGRGIETIIPNLAADIVAEKGYGKLSAEIIETERNTPARNVFEQSGFDKVGNGQFWELKVGTQKVPKWIKYKINLET